jgi:23S rRNA (cytidine1920-2'-O)/16S rRNA (cytidine1409-2'-O)-methyltransferase
MNLSSYEKTMPMKKQRIDKLLFERGLASSREKANALIMAGCVFIGEVRIEKAGQLVAGDSLVTVRLSDNPYVSRGGLKLERALTEFAIAVQGKKALDVGASTGGFTDCLLQHGILQVYALDVGHGQMDPKIARDPRVVHLERVNVRHVLPSDFPGPFDLITIDVSFIGLRLVLGVVKELLSGEGEIIALVKPQFEVGKGQVGKKGIVRDQEKQRQVLREVIDFAQSIGLCFRGLVASPITGAKGNQEFLLHLTLPALALPAPLTCPAENAVTCPDEKSTACSTCSTCSSCSAENVVQEAIERAIRQRDIR